MAGIESLLTVPGALVAFLSMVGVASPSEQRREHRLQSSDEIICFLVTLQERGDLGVLHLDLIPEEFALLSKVVFSLSSSATRPDVSDSGALCRSGISLVS